MPTVGTLYTLWLVLSYLDRAIGSPIPGLGLLLTGALVLASGWAVTHVVGQAALQAFERTIRTVPLVSLLYTSLKDLLGAFIGDKKSFERPAMVSLDPEGRIRVLGFVTCDRFDDVRLADMCAVYLPQAYNFAGNLLVVPRAAVEPVDADPAQFLAFIVSGGVSNLTGARTEVDATSTRSLASFRS